MALALYFCLARGIGVAEPVERIRNDHHARTGVPDGVRVDQAGVPTQQIQTGPDQFKLG